MQIHSVCVYRVPLFFFFVLPGCRPFPFPVFGFFTKHFLASRLPHLHFFQKESPSFLVRCLLSDHKCFRFATDLCHRFRIRSCSPSQSAATSLSSSREQRRLRRGFINIPCLAPFSLVTTSWQDFGLALDAALGITRRIYYCDLYQNDLLKFKMDD